MELTPSFGIFLTARFLGVRRVGSSLRSRSILACVARKTNGTIVSHCFSLPSLSPAHLVGCLELCSYPSSSVMLTKGQAFALSKMDGVEGLGG